MIRLLAAVAASAVLIACGAGPPDDTPTPSSATAAPTTAVPSPTQSLTTAVPSPTPSLTTAAPTPDPVTCEPFGSVDDQSSEDPLAMSALTGQEMRLGRHDCYERWVLQLQGAGDAPGWTVGYRDPLLSDPAGFVVDLAGSASLDVTIRAWTVTDFEGRPPEWPPFEGPTSVLTEGFVALLEAKYVAAFEGSSQFGLGVDQERPFRVFWLDDPPRLVIDVFTGTPLR